MELKRRHRVSDDSSVRVLIVPFMELKRQKGEKGAVLRGGLNRTFYGIETCKLQMGQHVGVWVLIVPFMELKPGWEEITGQTAQSLNRTFYGIETCKLQMGQHVGVCLNRTFYGIETTNTLKVARRVDLS